ncbi:hypothetical protein VNI00_013299 [Paramarasmius palmivorus]|uniref:Carboxylesterase type B domain-containing protein n=1 Tax=Paramarasmius palmivorus TaxID=297713 RepID=A0AAW0C131_9AGAR
MRLPYAFVLVASQAWASELMVSTTSGRVQGFVDTSTPGIDIPLKKWLGVRYAADTSGDNRWRPPQPVAAKEKEGVFNATAYGPACLQGRADGGNGTSIQSEDCLRINIVAPHNASGLPVYLYSHGGGFDSGASSDPKIDGSYLAAKGIVFASYNYRLSLFGYPHALELAEAGETQNLGLLDTRAAVLWLRRNVAKFGGDPEKITLGGESVGAEMTNQYLSAFPRDSFIRGAIMQSGDTSQPMWEMNSQLVLVATNLSCPTTHGTLACLRKKSGFEVQKALLGTGAQFQPVTDNITIFKDYVKQTKEGRTAKVPLLVGTNKDEGTLIVEGEPTAYLDDIVQYSKSNNLNFPFANTTTLQRLYPVPSTTYPSAYNASAAMWRDAHMLCLASNLATHRTLELDQPVWRYRFDHVANNLNSRGTRIGAFHGEDIRFVMGTWRTIILSPPFVQASEDQVKISDLMVEGWTNFVKDPEAGPRIPGWKQYDPSDTTTLAILGSNEVPDGVQDGDHIKTDEVCAYWNEVLPIFPQAWALDPDLVVSTTSGNFQGFLDTSLPGIDIPLKKWLGVRYAADTSGENRWRPPQLVTERESAGILNATSYGPACLQGRVDGGNGTSIQSEDCLRINIVAPHNASGLPVYLYSHGGGFDSGASSDPKIDGSYLAAKGIVFASYNYRLSLFGYPHALELAEAGETQNLGLLDTRAAILWLRSNAAMFGGDPEKITFGGESAGASMTTQYLAAFAKEPVIRGAILQSSSTSQPMWDINSKLALVATNLSCPTTHGALACLRKKSGLEVQKALLSTGAPFQPVVDNITIFKDYVKQTKEGMTAKIPMLIGTNKDEGTLNVENEPTAYLDSIDQYCKSGNLNVPFANVTILKHIYPVPSSTYPSVYNASAAMNRDSHMVCHASNLATHRTLDLGLLVWRYRFDHVASNLNSRGTRIGAFHGSDIRFVMGLWRLIVLTPPFVAATEDQVKISDLMVEGWTNFVKDPEAGPLISGWRRYDPNDTTTLAILGSAELPDGVQDGDHLEMDEACAYWNELLPILPQHTELVQHVVPRNKLEV